MFQQNTDTEYKEGNASVQALLRENYPGINSLYVAYPTAASHIATNAPIRGSPTPELLQSKLPFIVHYF